MSNPSYASLNTNVSYELGKKDQLTYLFMELRTRDDREVLREFAERAALNEENLNAVWYLKHKK